MLRRKKGLKSKVLPILLALLLVFNFTMTTVAIDLEIPDEESLKSVPKDWKEECIEAGGMYAKYEDGSWKDSIEGISELIVVTMHGKASVDWKLTEKAINEGYYVNKVGVKGGNEYNDYIYMGSKDSDTGLIAPNGKDISHVAFCLGKKTPPEDGILRITKELFAEKINSELKFTIEVWAEIEEGESLILIDEASLANGESKSWEVLGEFWIKEVANDDVDLANYNILYYVNGELTAPSEDGFVKVNVEAGKEVLILVKNTEKKTPPDSGTIRVEKEVLGLENEDTTDFTIIVRNEALEIVKTFSLAEGEFDTHYLAPGTYYLMEIEIPVDYELKGYYEGLTELFPETEGDKSGYIKVVVTKDNTTSIKVVNELLEIPPERGIIQVEKEVLGENGDDTNFTIIVRNENLVIVKTFTLANGESDTLELLPGTYYLMEIEIPEGFNLDGYFEYGEGWMELSPATEGDTLGHVEVVVVEDETTRVKVVNEVVEAPGTIRVEKEVLGLENEDTTIFTIIVRNEALEIVKTFSLADGEFDTHDLAPGTYYLMEISIPAGFALEGYYEDEEGLIERLPATEGPTAGHIELVVAEEDTIRIKVVNEVVETPPPNDDPGDPGDETPPITIIDETPTETVTVEEPAPAVVPEATAEPAPEVVVFEEPTVALPNTGGNNALVRVLGLTALFAGLALRRKVTA